LHEGQTPAQGGVREKIATLDRRFGIFKLAKFAIAAGSGFLLGEAIITLSVWRLYGSLTAPRNAYSSPDFLTIDVSALALGVALSFFLNERFTVRDQQRPQGGSNSLPFRLLKFEGVNALGNATIIAVQFALLATLSVTPSIGNIIGAIVSYPVTYLMSMHFIWQNAKNGPKENHLVQRTRERTKKVGPVSPPLGAVVILVALYVASQLVRRKDRHAQ
jgi:putative flippase GtrA